MSTTVIIDTDPGVDDYIAILLALNSPGLALRGLTATGGNASLSDATTNALHTLEVAGRTDIPVAIGADSALNGPFVHAEGFHGPSGLSITPPPPAIAPVEQTAVDWLFDRLATSGSPVTVIALGPLTNIARLFQERPAARNRIHRLVVMGGAVDCPGNVTDAAEFNVWNDPEAAEIVLNAGVSTTLIGFDVCNRVTFSRNYVGKMGRPAVEMLTEWFNTPEGRDEFQLCDPLAVAAAIDPTLVTTVATAVSVDTSAGAARGATGRSAAGHQIDVALDVDIARAKAFISDRVFRAQG